MRKPSGSGLHRRGRLQDGQLTIGLDLGDRVARISAESSQ